MTKKKIVKIISIKKIKYFVSKSKNVDEAFRNTLFEDRNKAMNLLAYLNKIHGHGVYFIFKLIN